MTSRSIALIHPCKIVNLSLQIDQLFPRNTTMSILNDLCIKREEAAVTSTATPMIVYGPS